MKEYFTKGGDNMKLKKTNTVLPLSKMKKMKKKELAILISDFREDRIDRLLDLRKNTLIDLLNQKLRRTGFYHEVKI
jgi:ADP-heptose:LPS heptosyltransferase